MFKLTRFCLKQGWKQGHVNKNLRGFFDRQKGGSYIVKEITAPLEEKIKNVDPIYRTLFPKGKDQDWRSAIVNPTVSGWEFGVNTVKLSNLDTLQSIQSQELALKSILIKFGNLLHVRVQPKKNDRYSSNGTAYVSFETRSAARACWKSPIQIATENGVNSIRTELILPSSSLNHNKGAGRNKLEWECGEVVSLLRQLHQLLSTKSTPVNLATALLETRTIHYESGIVKIPSFDTLISFPKRNLGWGDIFNMVGAVNLFHFQVKTDEFKFSQRILSLSYFIETKDSDIKGLHTQSASDIYLQARLSSPKQREENLHIFSSFLNALLRNNLLNPSRDKIGPMPSYVRNLEKDRFLSLTDIDERRSIPRQLSDPFNAKSILNKRLNQYRKRFVQLDSRLPERDNHSSVFP